MSLLKTSLMNHFCKITSNKELLNILCPCLKTIRPFQQFCWNKRWRHTHARRYYYDRQPDSLHTGSNDYRWRTSARRYGETRRNTNIFIHSIGSFSQCFLPSYKLKTCVSVLGLDKDFPSSWSGLESLHFHISLRCRWNLKYVRNLAGTVGNTIWFWNER